ncbi:DUF4112 domain-containing protein [Ponticaulis sp.]|uniref:DUF4112 domain-containing protein n=1 Tax=Ponticaulis sp. TaxID=2020902 RepID=UPI000B752EEE|nr:DUF4112 domain-containing protein [Ponticaulis sp.]MAI90346.1 hypothetical protein [Ponticaulis sp.]OUX99982.1 MAG: hypothetical protein CBB65_07895 [Hyphomonadaceae bacterium TMED5]
MTSATYTQRMEILDPEEVLTPEQEQALQQARALARLMDDQFSIGGFGIGLDGIIGLIPGVGDLFTSAMGMYHISLAEKLGMGWGTKAQMMANLGVDFVIGLVPLLGDFLDFGFKSHRKNMRLIEKKLEKRFRRV